MEKLRRWGVADGWNHRGEISVEGVGYRVVGEWPGGFGRGGYLDDGIGGVVGRLWEWGLMGWEGKGGECGEVSCGMMDD